MAVDRMRGIIVLLHDSAIQRDSREQTPRARE